MWDKGTASNSPACQITRNVIAYFIKRHDKIMNTSERIEIQLSKTKLTLMFIGSIIFVGLGIWYVTYPPKVNITIFSNPITVFIVGLASIIFFGVVGFSISRKLFDKSVGLILSNEGIDDNSSGVSAGFVPWMDVIEIKDTKVANQNIICLIVKNPQDYIDRQKNFLKKKSMQMNYKCYDTVIGISANGLKCNHKELKTMLDAKFEEFKSKSR